MVLGLIGFLVAFTLVGPIAYTNQAFFLTLIVYAILAVSLNIIYGYTGYLPFGFAVFFATGAYGFGIAVKFGFGVPVALVSGMGMSLLLSFVFIPLLKLRGVFFSVATLGAFEAVSYFVSISYPGVAKYTGGPLGIAMPQVYAPNETYYLAIVVLIISIVITFYISNSKFGLALRAIKNDVLSASLSGVNVSLNRNIAWWISAILSGAAGALYGWYISFFYPEAVFDITFTLFALVFLIFGGRGTVIGPILGTFVLYTLYYSVGVDYPLYFQAAFGIFVVAAILFIPNGIVDIIKRKLHTEVI